MDSLIIDAATFPDKNPFLIVLFPLDLKENQPQPTHQAFSHVLRI